MSNKLKRGLKELGSAALVFLVAYAGFQLVQRERQSGCEGGNLQSGVMAPEFDLPTLQGQKRVSLSERHGKPVVINFWATWCGACRSELPIIQELYDKHRDTIQVWTITDESPARLRQFMEVRQLDFPVLIDRGGTVSRRYKVKAYPTTVLIDADGKLVHDFEGGLYPDVIVERLISNGQPQGP